MPVPDLPMRERIAEALAHARCRETNPKADHPVFGYAAFSEDQREHLRAQQYDATEAVLAVLADLPDTAVEAGAKALYETTMRATHFRGEFWRPWDGVLPEHKDSWRHRFLCAHTAAIAAIKEGKA